MEAFFSKIRPQKKFREPTGSGGLFLIVGLGNPGREYRASRHNFGFMVVDRLVASRGSDFSKSQLKALTASITIQGNKVLVIKPQTFMNLSGEAAVPLLNYYKIPVDRMLVVHDDMDLPFGTLRMRPGGGAGGQKGLASIINKLGHQEFARLRCGIGHPPGQMEVHDYVLSQFSKNEEESLPAVIDKAAEAIETFVSEGIQAAMNRYNGAIEG